MKRIVSMILVLVLVLTALPVSVRASEAEIVEEDMVLDYGSFAGAQTGLELMAAGSGKTYEMADIPEGGKYQNMTASQEIIDVIKDFEGFRSKAYWDNSQWSVGYGTRCSGSGVTVTRAEAERLLRKVIEDTYGPVGNKFCKDNGKQPTQQQFDALLDLTYNVGGGWTTGSSVPDVLTGPVTARELVKGFGAWSRSGGGVSYVHVNRRIREALIFLYGEYYLAYGGQDCKSDLEVVSNDDLPHFKAVIFKTTSGKLETGKSDYAAYYAEGEYYGSFIGGKRDGYTLVGWKITKRGNDSVSGDVRASIWDKAQENLELTAVWQKGNVVVKPEEPPVDYEEPTEPEPTEPEMETMPEVEIDMDRLPFDDVPENAWFREAVSYVYRNEFMSGTSSTTFAPGGAMTRGMLVTVLYRIDGSAPVSDAECGCFEDIAGAYYTKPVAWAYSNGIVSGVSATRFDPNRIVTRQEAIAISYRYRVGQNGVNAQSGMELDSFADQADVAGYAQNAFTWAVATGLVVGSEGAGGVYLNPTTNLNRASAAVLLQRCVEDIM